MPKTGVLSVTPYSITEDMDLKKLYLMYDNIVIEKKSLEIARIAKDPIPEDLLPKLMEGRQPGQLTVFGDILGLQGDDQFAENLRNIDYLREIDFIEIWDFNQLTGYGNRVPIRYEGLFEELYLRKKDIHNLSEKEEVEFEPDAKIRLMSLMLQDLEDYRTIPILRQAPQKLQASRDTEVVNFLMGHFPQPEDSVSWEQLLDFKNDPDTMTSYYALGDWINETCRKEYSRHEIIDKFNHLYHQYEQQYRIHKMKFKAGIWEMLFTGALDAIAGNFGQAISTTLFRLSKAHANLLDAETKFPGREVAYIHKAKQQFSK